MPAQVLGLSEDNIRKVNFNYFFFGGISLWTEKRQSGATSVATRTRNRGLGKSHQVTKPPFAVWALGFWLITS
jgi:hypothetical protein